MLNKTDKMSIAPKLLFKILQNPQNFRSNGALLFDFTLGKNIFTGSISKKLFALNFER